MKTDIDSLIDELNCDQMMKCQEARLKLVAMGSLAVPALVRALSNRKQWVRWEAAKALSQIGDPASLQALVKALDDKEFDIRWIAAEGLVGMGRDALVPLLKALINNPDSLWLRDSVHHVLTDMYLDELEEVLKPVITALEGLQPSVTVPVAAEITLDKLRKAG
jgi:HEAT repeat protein